MIGLHRTKKPYDSVPDTSVTAHPAQQGPKLRKGTHSCWEFKRRKAKCVPSLSVSITACNTCRRRGVPCISQEYPEEAVLVGLTGGSGTRPSPPYAGDNGMKQSPRTTLSISTGDCIDRGTMSPEAFQGSLIPHVRLRNHDVMIVLLIA